MPLMLSVAALPLRDAAVLAVPTTPAGPEGGLPAVGAGAEALANLGVDVAAALAREEAKAEPGEIVAIPVGRDGVDTVLLAGVGDGSLPALRKAAAAVVRRSKSAETLATTLAHGRDDEAVRAVAESLALASYVFTRKSEPKPVKLTRATLAVSDPEAAEPVMVRARATAAAVHLARDLANTPSLEKSPEWMADRAVQLAAEHGLDAQVWDRRPPAPRRVRRHPRRRAWFGAAAASGPARPCAERRLAPRRARRQGHHLRLRWPVAEAQRGHGDDEDRHEWWRRRARGDDRAACAADRPAGDRAGADGREHARW